MKFNSENIRNIIVYSANGVVILEKVLKYRTEIVFILYNIIWRAGDQFQGPNVWRPLRKPQRKRLVKIIMRKCSCHKKSHLK